MKFVNISVMVLSLSLLAPSAFAGKTGKAGASKVDPTKSKVGQAVEAARQEMDLNGRVRPGDYAPDTRVQEGSPAASQLLDAMGTPGAHDSARPEVGANRGGVHNPLRPQVNRPMISKSAIVKNPILRGEVLKDLVSADVQKTIGRENVDKVEEHFQRVWDQTYGTNPEMQALLARINKKSGRLLSDSDAKAIKDLMAKIDESNPKFKELMATTKANVAKFTDDMALRIKEALGTGKVDEADRLKKYTGSALAYYSNLQKGASQVNLLHLASSKLDTLKGKAKEGWMTYMDWFGSKYKEDITNGVSAEKAWSNAHTVARTETIKRMDDTFDYDAFRQECLLA